MCHVSAIPINNAIVGNPEVECQSNGISINFNTENSFEGNVYVRNFYDKDECKLTPTGGNTLIAFEVTFDGPCNLQRARTANPKGVKISTVVVLSFHRRFITKVDRSFRIQCFYMEAEKTVSAGLEASVLTSSFASLSVPMPTCRYQLLSGPTPTATPIRFGLVGDSVYHKWVCDTDAADTFCMTVSNCKVDDGAGQDLQLIDNNGCSVDKFIIGNLEYTGDLMAGKEAHVFKFADRSQLYFNCEIAITVKELNTECKRPVCVDETVSRRRRRSLSRRVAHDVSGGGEEAPTVVDVAPEDPLVVADVGLTEEDISPILEYIYRDGASSLNADYNSVELTYARLNGELCLGPEAFGALMLLAVALVSLTSTLIITSCRKRKSEKSLHDTESQRSYKVWSTSGENQMTLKHVEI